MQWLRKIKLCLSNHLKRMAKLLVHYLGWETTWLNCCVINLHISKERLHFDIFLLQLLILSPQRLQLLVLNVKSMHSRHPEFGLRELEFGLRRVYGIMFLFHYIYLLFQFLYQLLVIAFSFYIYFGLFIDLFLQLFVFDNHMVYLWYLWTNFDFANVLFYCQMLYTCHFYLLNNFYCFF